MSKVRVQLRYKPGCSHVVEVEQAQLEGVSIILYKEEYYVFNGIEGKFHTIPIFNKVKHLEIRP
jgi:hypothetical protein